METRWMQYTVLVGNELEDALIERAEAGGYTLGWVEPAIEVVRTDNGYDYVEQADVPLTAYLFEPLEESPDVHIDRFRAFLSVWDGRAELIAAEETGGADESWKEAYGPVRIGGWVVAPSWVPAERMDSALPVLWIDPGSAFGTGYHGTTQDILRLLQQESPAGRRVLDIGAGSGILSVFCAVNGAAEVWAVDINPSSAGEIAHNLALNGLSPDAVLVVIGDPLEEPAAGLLPREVDLVLVNIGAEEDIAMLPVVRRTLVPGGTAILSGIVEWKRDEVLAACREAGLTVEKECASNEWLTIATRLWENTDK